MKTATIAELKSQLSNRSPGQLTDLCLRLARFKKENKELLTYLLFESFDEDSYVENIKAEMKLQFEGINTSSLYFVKKSLRKILRFVNKVIRYTSSAEVAIRLLLFFCKTLKESGIAFETNPVINNIYHSQLKKIAKSISALHEDLQYDYQKDLHQLS